MRVVSLVLCVFGAVLAAAGAGLLSGGSGVINLVAGIVFVLFGLGIGAFGLVTYLLDLLLRVFSDRSRIWILFYLRLCWLVIHSERGAPLDESSRPGLDKVPAD
jgi:hypothetical protein